MDDHSTLSPREVRTIPSPEFLSDAFGQMLEDEQKAGKPPVVTCTVEGTLQPGDIAAYLEARGSLPAKKSDEKDLALTRARHHGVARLLAAGLGEGLVASLSGYTASYISTLKQAPQMQELIAHYRAPGAQAAFEIAERLRTVGHAALEKLALELPTATVQELIQIVKLGADRSGNGPMSTLHNITEVHLVDHAEVARLERTAREGNKSRIVDLASIRKQLPGPSGQAPEAEERAAE